MNPSPRSVTAAESIIMEMNPKVGPTTLAAKSDDSNQHQDNISMEYPRSLVFEIAALVGELSTLFLTRVPLDPPFEPLPTDNQEDAETNDDDDDDDTNNYTISRPTSHTVLEDTVVAKAMGAILLKLLQLCHTLDLQLVRVVRKKIALNNKKYPASLCKGKSGKYTKYSAITGITKDAGQSTLEEKHTIMKDQETVEDFLLELERLTLEIGNFARERLWSRYHKPRNLLLALLGELGEVCGTELFIQTYMHSLSVYPLSNFLLLK